MEETINFNEEINQEVDFSNIFATGPVTNKKAESVSDGLIMSLSNRGKVDIPYIAELCQKEKYEVLQELRGSIFQNPNSWNEQPYEGWETKEEYLSGNLRKKLIEAEAQENLFPGVFEENINVLKEITNDEKHHAGGLYKLLELLSPTDLKEYEHGYDETLENFTDDE